MRTLTLTLGVALASLTVSAASQSLAQTAPQLITGGAQAPAQLVFGRDVLGDPLLEKAQFLWGGRNYCFYDSGWRGPGYYRCGYAFRRGYGWGGPVGWHGWSGHGGYHGGYHGGGYHGGGGGHMGGGEFHGGGHMGGGHEGGGHPGGGGHGGGGGDHHH